MILNLLLLLSGLFIQTDGNADIKGPQQHQITCQIKIDTSKWEPIAYLSKISDFSQMNTISYSNVLEEHPIDNDGQFSFSTKNLDQKDRLYRIHISKKGDPAASLSIGGKDHNHFFFITNQLENIKVNSSLGPNLFNDMNIKGNQANIRLNEVNEILSLLDTLELYGTNLSREFIREATCLKLLEYADTCSVKLVSDYARYKSGLNVKQNNKWVWTLVVLTLLILSSTIRYIIYKRKTQRNPLATLTLQERKIYALLKEGKSNKEIAEECSISISTVKSHVNNVYSKLGVSSRREVVDI